DARSLYEEGLQIPPCKLYHAGEPGDVMALLAENVRVPDQVIGDVRAMISAAHVGRARLIEFLTDYDMPDLEALSAEIRARSCRRRAASLTAASPPPSRRAPRRASTSTRRSTRHWPRRSPTRSRPAAAPSGS